jgi:hypothetical protein
MIGPRLRTRFHLAAIGGSTGRGRVNRLQQLVVRGSTMNKKNVLINIAKALARRPAKSSQQPVLSGNLDEENSKGSWSEILESDIYFVSYPRSGNTWLRNVLSNLRFPDAEWNLYSLSVAFPETGSDVDPRSVPQPRWIKSHHGYKPQYPKVVYLVRDARDVAVSFYHWSGLNQSTDFASFVRSRLLSESGGVPAWQDHVKSWLNGLKEDHLIIRYEDLISEGATAEFQRLVSFMGLDRSTDQIQRALHKSTYQKQQRDFDAHHVLKGLRVGVGAGRGKWREYFDNGLLDEFWETAGSAMRLAGYEREANS